MEMEGRPLDRPADSIRKLKDFCVRCTVSRDATSMYDGRRLLRETNWEVLELLVGARTFGVSTEDDPVGLDLVHLVALCAKVPALDLLSDKRNKQTVAVRHVAIYLVRHHDQLSFPALGRLFSKDTSTIQYAVRKVRRLLDEGHGPVTRLCTQVESALRISKFVGAPSTGSI